MTHEVIASLLGVRREGVTMAAQKLMQEGTIRYARGRITILDKPALEQRVCECYGVIRQEYERLLPVHKHGSH
jgi:Mn-dependent DtxR family transcriptional regulator